MGMGTSIINLLIAFIYATSFLLEGNCNAQDYSNDKRVPSNHVNNNAHLASSSNVSLPVVRNNNMTVRSFSLTSAEFEHPKPFNQQSNSHSHTGTHTHNQQKPLPYQTSPIPLVRENKSHPHEEHEKIAATTIFRNLLRMSFANANKTNNSLPVYQELTFYDEQTIATIYTNITTNEVHCNLIEVITPEESDRVLRRFAMQNRKVQKTNFRTILAIITACQALDSDEKGVKKKKSGSFLPFLLPVVARDNNMDSAESAESIFSGTQASPSDMWTVISGILPGTKWCGLGDIANEYSDLGTERTLDKCCRAHDHCPTKLKALRSGYGLVNWSFYTKSHCECDSLLFDCLKKARSSTADMLGNFYFNLLKVQCIDEEDPMKCALMDDLTNQCKLWQPDTERGSKRMYFRNIRREF